MRDITDAEFDAEYARLERAAEHLIALVRFSGCPITVERIVDEINDNDNDILPGPVGMDAFAELLLLPSRHDHIAVSGDWEGVQFAWKAQA